MKKALKIIFFIFTSIIILFSVFALFLNLYLKDVTLDHDKLVNLDRVITFFDDEGNVFAKESNGVAVTETENIPEHTKHAFISIEDKRFYSHKGVDSRALLRATFNNIKSFSLKEGASTISQQLIKNTHLSGEKTLKRKLKEIKLTRILEKKYSKNEILEKYLNTIYFGNNCYGISSASRYYFDKSVSQLEINESAVLAAIIKAPANYSPIENKQRCFNRKNLVLKEMFNQGYISEFEYNENKDKFVSLNENNTQNRKQPFNQTYLIRQELNEILENNPYSSNNIDVYTFFNAKAQEILEENISDFSHLNVNKSAILMDKHGKVIAYYSDCGDVKRQLGSVLKPLAVYAPAIENDVVNSQTILSDKQTDFNGYCPSNYNDKYFGDISVKDSIAKSSNVCAVKLLNSIDIKNSIKNLNKLGLNVSDEDANLTLALGATKNGEKLSKITAAYNLFLNNGYYSNVKTVDKIKTKKSTIFSSQNKSTKIFDKGTVGIMNDMLKNVVENGTAKKLTETDMCLYAKTGTVGNKNGNTDAYIISYNSDYILGVWFGAKDNKLMSNDITGGTYPATFSANFWKSFYADKITPTEILNEGVKEVYIDKISYEEDGKVLLVDEDTPERYKLKAIFKDSAIPKSVSKRFLEPKIETPKTSINNNIIEIKLCLTEFINVLIYKTENGKKQLVFDSKEFGDNFTEPLNYSSIIQYSIVPYFVGKNKTNYGKEIFLDKIKTPNKEFGDNWWENIFE